MPFRFDSPLQLLIILLLILLLFGASRLPNTARQLGRSMRIFKSEMREMRDDKPRRDDDTPDEQPSRIEALEGKVVDERPAAPVREQGAGVDSGTPDRDR